jgi:hypothetical protein
MQTIPADFLEGLLPIPSPQDRLVNTWRWIFCGLLVFGLLLMLMSLGRLQQMAGSHAVVICVYVELGLEVGCLVQLLRKRPSGWMLTIFLATLFLTDDITGVWVISIVRFKIQWVVYVMDILYWGLLLLNIGTLIVFLRQRGLTFFGVNPVARTWVVALSLLLVGGYIAFVSLPFHLNYLQHLPKVNP